MQKKIKQKGQAPLAGRYNTRLGGPDMKLSFYPTPAQKESMFKNQINYVEQDLKATYLGSQSTMQRKKSALSEIPTVRTLLVIIKELEDLLEDFRYSKRTPENQSRLSNETNNLLRGFVSSQEIQSAQL